ncbi:uncharacterized protein SPSK_10047 [Sporothrix schenckii 1099-18]|uniref:Uncharacterized protein n=1 Tax=Sporothrix schenckii 1099-18 TaxID=1397361 RepID=A0A0F2M8K9_SPOSC|nr:uncharacterized protein SPSK_10047 [Sporothrix schenckii 1099-18]KJR85160.1 hypothetical protein SPSK_10047 [Sporothrix schenckii 1099-18]
MSMQRCRRNDVDATKSQRTKHCPSGEDPGTSRAVGTQSNGKGRKTHQGNNNQVVLNAHKPDDVAPRVQAKKDHEKAQSREEVARNHDMLDNLGAEHVAWIGGDRSLRAVWPRICATLLFEM